MRHDENDDKLSDAQLDRLIKGDQADELGDGSRVGARSAEDVEIKRLAALSLPQYEHERKRASEKLNMRTLILDRLVGAERAQQKSTDNALPHWHVEPCPDPVDGAALLDAIRQVFRRYIFLPQGADIALALWVLHAWTMDAGEISPFMVLVSPTKRCGKTSVLILLQYLTPRSELASNITPSALFRYIEKVRPTLLIDEADSFVKDNEELRGILNSGHTKTAAYVIRTVEVAGDHKPRRFSTWAAKAIATIMKLADTLVDRAVTVPLQRKPPGARVERLRRRDNDEFAKLRSQAARWAADNFEHLADPDPQMPAELNDRAADNWRPLLAIADLAGGEWPQLARQAALTLSGESPEEAMGVMLLADCHLAFGDDDVIRSVDLVTRLSADPERPWAEYNHGKPITPRQIARLLGAFGIISVNVRPEVGPQGKGYRRLDFEEPWAAYCPGQIASRTDSDISIRPTVPRPVGSTQVGNFASVPDAPWDGSKNSNLSNNHAGWDGGTDRKPESGARSGSATTKTPSGDPGDILRRSPGKTASKATASKVTDNPVSAVSAPHPLDMPSGTNGGGAHRRNDLEDCPLAPDSPPPSDCLLRSREVLPHRRTVLDPPDDNLDIPDDLLRCQLCSKPGAERWDLNGRAVYLHERCVHPWADQQERARAFTYLHA
jgi:Protein of unknown function (DUF3631)